MMREKIKKALEESGLWLQSPRIATDLILAAIGEGQEPVAVISPHGFLQLNDDKYVGNLYRDPQPAPDVAAMKARIAELEEERKALIGEMHRLAVSAVELERLLADARSAAKDFNEEAHKLAGKVEELERVQGTLVGALKVGLEFITKLEDDDDYTEGQVEASFTVRAALAEAQKPAADQKGEQQ